MVECGYSSDKKTLVFLQLLQPQKARPVLPDQKYTCQIFGEKLSTPTGPYAEAYHNLITTTVNILQND